MDDPLEPNSISRQTSSTELVLEPEHIEFLGELVRCRQPSWFDKHGEEWSGKLNEDYRLVLAGFARAYLTYEPVQTKTGGITVSRKGARVLAQHSKNESVRAAAIRKRFTVCYRKPEKP